MALGKAVIITKTNGTMDYFIDNVNGLFVEPYNARILNQKIEELLNDEKKMLYLGEKARDFVKGNCIITKYLEKLYRELGFLV